MRYPLARQQKAAADRHWLKGFMHSVNGRHAFAAGSYVKALKHDRHSVEIEQRYASWRAERPNEAYAVDCLVKDVEAAFSRMFR